VTTIRPAQGPATGRALPPRTPVRRAPRLDGVRVSRIVLWAVVAAVTLTPFVVVLVLAVGHPRFEELLTADVAVAARNSVVSSVLSAAIALAFGTLTAILVERTDVRGRRALRTLVLSPLLVPPFIGAIAWVGVAGPSSDVNRWWTATFGGPLWNVYGGDGVVFLLAVHGFPVAHLLVAAALRRVPAELEQAARIAGASSFRAVVDVTLPLIRSTLVAAFLLLAVGGLADFGIPSIVGTPERYTTLATVVYRFVQSGTVDDPLSAVATLGTLMLVVTAAALVAVHHADRRSGRAAVDGVPERLPLGRARGSVTSIAWVVVAAITVLPVLALVEQTLLPAPGVALSPDTATLANLRTAVTNPSVRTGVVNSLWLALAAAAVCGVVGLAVGVLTVRARARGDRLLAALAVMPQSVPGIVTAVGWLVIAPALHVFNTPWLILLAYVTAFLGLVVQAVTGPLAGVPAALEEAARASGASRLRSLLDVSARLATPAAVSGAALVALTAFRELTISALLLAPGSQTLGVAIFNLQLAGSYNTAAALALLVTVVGLAGLGLVGVERTPGRRSAARKD
jgi:iron(III) transport system permease protein